MRAVRQTVACGDGGLWGVLGVSDLMWGVTCASLVGVVANVYKLRWCFAVWAVTNATWAIYDYRIGANAQAALQAVYFGLSIWGLWKWKATKNS